MMLKTNFYITAIISQQLTGKMLLPQHIPGLFKGLSKCCAALQLNNKLKSQTPKEHVQNCIDLGKIQ